MKGSARVVVIGGGAVGCSALYHLTRLGWTDVALLERDELTAGSTWHAAGNCPNFSTSWNILKLQRHSTALYEKLAQEVDLLVGRHRLEERHLPLGRHAEKGDGTRDILRLPSA